MELRGSKAVVVLVAMPGVSGYRDYFETSAAWRDRSPSIVPLALDAPIAWSRCAARPGWSTSRQGTDGRPSQSYTGWWDTARTDSSDTTWPLWGDRVQVTSEYFKMQGIQADDRLSG